MKRLFIYLALLMLIAAVPVRADPVMGTWLSPPDHKGQVGHMQLAQCGDTICGRLVRVFDRAGKPITTPNVGKRLVWDMRGDGTDFQGKVYVPLMKGTFRAEMKVSGNRLTVRGCSELGLCKAQTWTRVN